MADTIEVLKLVVDVVAERNAAIKQRDAVRAQLHADDQRAWEALGRPEGAYETTNVQRLCAEVDLLRAELDALRADIAATTRVLPACCGSLADAAKELADERDAARAEVERLRARVAELEQQQRGIDLHGIYDTIDAVRIEGAKLLEENEQLRADLREAVALLRAYGQPHYWVGLKDAIDWNTRWGKLLAKHKETP